MFVEITSSSAKETVGIGKKLGANLKGGEVIELVSDLGGGKTTFTKGLAQGAGSHELVSSPSFTICNEYSCPKFKIYHFDFYRLSDPGIISRELAEVMSLENTVLVIEWPEVIENILPELRLVVSLKNNEQGARMVSIDCPQELSYLIGSLK